METRTYIKNEVTFIEVKNDDGMKVTLTDLGASIYAIQIDENYMTVTPNKVEEFKLKENYHGKTLAGIANRVKDGKVVINGETYQMDINEQTNCLHGGREGTSNQYFFFKIKRNDDSIDVIFTFLKQDLLDGLPGNINYNVTYTIKKDINELDVHYDVLSDKDTVVGITNHAFYCLGDPNLDKLYLTIKAKQYIFTNGADLLPLRYEDIKGTLLDFNEKKLIVKDIHDPSLKDGRKNGYDFHSVFTDIGIDLPNLILENDRYEMTLYTDCPGVQIYDDNMGNTATYYSTNEHYYCGLAIEAQESLLDRPLIKAGENYQRTWKIVFKRK